MVKSLRPGGCIYEISPFSSNSDVDQSQLRKDYPDMSYEEINEKLSEKKSTVETNNVHVGDGGISMEFAMGPSMKKVKTISLTKSKELKKWCKA